MRAQKDKILADAREEADAVIAEAREAAEKEGRVIVENLRKEAQQKLEEETRNFQSYAQTQADEIRADTEKRAAELLRAIDQDSRNVNGLLADSIKRYEVILAQLKEAVQGEVGEIAKNVTAARKQIENKLTSYTASAEEETTARTVKAPSASSLWVTLGEAVEGEALNRYKGRLDLKTLSVVDHRKIRSLKAFLTRVQNVKYIGESSNDEGTVLSFEITEPMPLMEILDNIPDVITSEQSGNNIKLTLN
jgi:vacuolar-type H+-ATPase subunit H